MTPAELPHEQQTDRTDRRLVAGRYRLNARIGRGRIGDIYEADDEQHGDVGTARRVAIQLLPGKIAQNRPLFNKLKLGYAEIRAASHPNIVSYFDVEHDGRHAYLAMDYLDGASLRFVLNDVTTLSWYEASPVIRAVGDALQFLHAKSIVHGQLTAENVFITADLDVRLLDVVPLDSASPTLRGVDSKDSVSHCDTVDDVYGLGCLTYEMLTGRHPFNFLAPADARRAGIKLAPIATLPEKQWNALRRTLAFDREQRTPTVANFLQAFGITGTERLQPAARSADPPPSVRASNQLASDNQLDPPIGPIAEPYSAREKYKAMHKGAKRLPSPILVVTLVGLSTWLGYGQPQNDIVTLTNYVDLYLAGRIATSDDVSLPISVVDLAPAPLIAEDAANVETTGTTVAAATLPADEPLVDSAANTSRLDDDVEVDTPASEAVLADAPQSTSQLIPVQSYIILSEGDVAARITVRRPGNPAERVFWWTSDQNAIADKDYIPIERPVEGFTSGEVFETLRIPLINDSLPESQETFYVFLGQHNSKSGRLEPVLRVRVDIRDDD